MREITLDYAFKMWDNINTKIVFRNFCDYIDQLKKTGHVII